jgi:hypothetical protein
MVAMETQAPYELADDDAVIAHRARAASMLDQIAQQVKVVLAAEGIDLPVFFIVPSSGDSILIYGCAGDPPDNEWSEVGEIVEAVVQQSLGLRGTRRRKVQCAST